MGNRETRDGEKGGQENGKERMREEENGRMNEKTTQEKGNGDIKNS